MPCSLFTLERPRPNEPQTSAADADGGSEHWIHPQKVGFYIRLFAYFYVLRTLRACSAFTLDFPPLWSQMEVALRNFLLSEEAVALLRLLSRGPLQDTAALSSLLYFQSVRAAAESQRLLPVAAPGAASAEESEQLQLLRNAASRLQLLTPCGKRVQLPPGQLASDAEWPGELLAVLLPVSGAAPTAVTLNFAGASCALQPLADALDAAGGVVLSRPLGSRPKPGRARGEPRLYSPAGKESLRLNRRASWLAGADVFGDALLAHLAPPPRRFSGASAVGPICLSAADVHVHDYATLAAASLPTALLARLSSGDGPIESAPKRALAELCSRLAPASPGQSCLESWALAADCAPPEPLFVQASDGALGDALASLQQLCWEESSPAGAGWCAVATPPPGPGRPPPRVATAATRAAAENAAALALLHDMEALGEAELGGGGEAAKALPFSAPPPPPPPRLFSPPLGEQRRAVVMALLRAARAESVLDAGCGGGALLHALLQGQYGGAGPQLRRLAGVEVSAASYQRACASVADCMADVQLVHGSLHGSEQRWGAAAFDAVVCVEVLEHLADEEEAALAGAGLLRLARRLAVFTTPNADANAAMQAAAAGVHHLPPDARASGAFRDADHKFEWSREQFAAWARTAADAAGGGWRIALMQLGALRQEVQPTGCARAGATQAAVFWREGGDFWGGTS